MVLRISVVLASILSACAGSEDRVRPAGCSTPPLPAVGQALSETSANQLNLENRAYRDCVRAYVESGKVIVEKHQAIANAHAQAANAVRAEFDRYRDELQSTLQAREQTGALPSITP